MLEGSEVAKFFASFIILIVFIYALYYYISKIGLKFTAKNGKNIKILETLFFSKNRSLQLIEINDKILLLANDEKGIHKLKEWDKKEFYETRKQEDEKKSEKV